MAVKIIGIFLGNTFGRYDLCSKVGCPDARKRISGKFGAFRTDDDLSGFLAYALVGKAKIAVINRISGIQRYAVHRDQYRVEIHSIQKTGVKRIHDAVISIIEAECAACDHDIEIRRFLQVDGSRYIVGNDRKVFFSAQGSLKFECIQGPCREK